MLEGNFRAVQRRQRKNVPEFLHLPARFLLVRETVLPERGLIPVQDLAVQGGNHQALAEVLDDGVKLRLALAHTLLGPLALGEVAANSHHADDVPGGVLERNLGGQDEPLRAVRVGHRFLLVENLATTEDILFIAPELAGLLLWIEVPVGFPDQVFRPGCTHDPRDSLVCQEETALGVFHVDVVRQQIDQRAEQGALAVERLPGPLALGDVAHMEEHGGLAREDDLLAGDFHRHGTAIRRPTESFRLRKIASRQLGKIAGDRFPLGRRHEIRDMPPHQIRVRHAMQLAGGGIGIQHHAPVALDKDRIRRVLEQLAEPLLTRVQRLLGPLALGDVAGDPQRCLDDSGGVTQRCRMGLQPAARSFEPLQLEFERARLAPHDTLQQSRKGGAVLRQDQAEQGPADDLGQRIRLDDPQSRGIHLQERSIRPDEFHTFRLSLEDRAQPVLTRGELLLRLETLAMFLRRQQRALHGRGEPIEAILEQVIRRARVQAAHRLLLADGAGHDDERHIQPALFQQRERLQPCEFRHRVIADDDVPRPAAQRRRHGLRRVHALVLGQEIADAQHAEHEQGIVFHVLHQQDSQGPAHCGFLFWGGASLITNQ